MSDLWSCEFLKTWDDVLPLYTNFYFGCGVVDSVLIAKVTVSVLLGIYYCVQNVLKYIYVFIFLILIIGLCSYFSCLSSNWPTRLNFLLSGEMVIYICRSLAKWINRINGQICPQPKNICFWSNNSRAGALQYLTYYL